MKFSPVSLLRSSLAVLVLLLVTYSRAHAAYFVTSTPEIDPSLSIGGLALLSGVVLMVRGRRKP